MPNTKRDKYAKALDTLQCVIDELADMIKRHNRQDPETGVWDYDYGGVAEAQKALGDLRSAFPPPAEDAMQCAKHVIDASHQNIETDEIDLTEAAIYVEAFAESRVEPWREALRAESALLRAWAKESRDGGWSTHQVEPMRKRADAIDALLSDSPAREAR